MFFRSSAFGVSRALHWSQEAQVSSVRAAYAEELNFAPAIAAFAGNAALVGAGFHLSREMTRLVRQRDDWINSCVGGAVAGSAVATAFRGRAYSPAGAAAYDAELSASRSDG